MHRMVTEGMEGEFQLFPDHTLKSPDIPDGDGIEPGIFHPWQGEDHKLQPRRAWLADEAIERPQDFPADARHAFQLRARDLSVYGSLQLSLNRGASGQRGGPVRAERPMETSDSARHPAGERT
jgi:hypothetical protein